MSLLSSLRHARFADSNNKRGLKSEVLLFGDFGVLLVSEARLDCFGFEMGCEDLSKRAAAFNLQVWLTNILVVSLKVLYYSRLVPKMVLL